MLWQEKADPASLLKKYEAQIRELKNQLVLSRKVPATFPPGPDESSDVAGPSAASRLRVGVLTAGVVAATAAKPQCPYRVGLDVRLTFVRLVGTE